MKGCLAGLNVRRWLCILAAVSTSCSATGMPADGGDASSPTHDLSVDLAPPDCTRPASFSAIKTDILQYCAGGYCHHQAPFAAGLDLTAPSAYTALVNTPAVEAPALLRVRPGAPLESFLWRKLDNQLPGDGSQGQPMPLGAEYIWLSLAAARRAQVYCWIQAGAPND